MREKYSFHFSYNPPAVVVSLLNAYKYKYIGAHTAVYVPEHWKLTFNHGEFLFKKDFFFTTCKHVHTFFFQSPICENQTLSNIINYY